MAKDHLKEERLQILKLLAEGKINAEEAESLLAAIDGETPVTTEVVSSKKGPFRMLKINIDSDDGEKVRVQVPLEFAKVLKKGGKFGGVDLKDYDLDLDAILEMIEKGALGELVNIEDDDDKIKIFVE